MPRPAFIVALGAALVLLVLASTRQGAQLASDAVGAVVDALKPRGIRNNNPGNLVRTSIAWKGKVASADDARSLGLPWDTRFEVFAEARWGVRALGRDLLADAGKGRNTVRTLLAEYAPPSENDTEAYVRAVAGELRVGADDSIAVRDRLPALAAAIIRHENGSVPYSDAELREWVYLS